MPRQNKYRTIISLLLATVLSLGVFGVIQYTQAAEGDEDITPNEAEGVAEETASEGESDEELDQTILELNLLIQERKQELDELNTRFDTLKKNISLKQQEGITLSKQIESIDDQVATTELEIQITETELDTLELQIREVKSKIKDREDQIVDQKARLAELLRRLQTYQDKNFLEILLRENRFSNFFNEVNYVEEIQHKLKGFLDEVIQLKDDLGVIQTDLESNEANMQNTVQKLEVEKQSLEGQQIYKARLLDETLQSEDQYQDLLRAVQVEQNAVNSEVQTIEETVRKTLEGGDLLEADDASTLSWPVSPVGGITAYFYDPTYPFRSSGEHDAIDIRAKQGTPVKAAASGYVARAISPQDSGLGLSWIMIIHANGLSTLYLHMSDVKVEEDQFVARGQVIGLSGGMPGTPGAGRQTTGPHLHFGVRLNGIPVDPLNYLP
ncbi:MAG: peptidoglycan DD-metalloendopeptidase family protein [bacterium]|nr:peptidoglycan DD-metalloendopeptidase family protein [bacterium]